MKSRKSQYSKSAKVLDHGARILRSASIRYRSPDRLIQSFLAALFPQWRLTGGTTETYCAEFEEALEESLQGLKLSSRIAPVSLLPKLQKVLLADAGAILNGDPAAQSLTEIILAYPGFYATAVYRLAHELHRLNLPLLPRVITEFAHQRTGIDIHPGAKIGEAFCIDHGTGIVIGETTIIGKGVKLYQGVTLGALSVSRKLRTKKRHPTLRDSVVVYANATILGGTTVVGEGSVIGGNVWLTHSVPAQSTVYSKEEIVTRKK